MNRSLWVMGAIAVLFAAIAVVLTAGCTSNPVRIVRERTPLAAPAPLAQQVAPLGKAIDRAVSEVDGQTKPALAVAVHDTKAEYEKFVPAVAANDAAVASIVQDRNQMAVDANAIDLAKAGNGDATPKTFAQKIARWIIGVTVAVAVLSLLGVGLFAYRLQFLNMTYCLVAAGAIIVAGIVLSFIAMHWLWFAGVGLLVIAGLVYHRWHDLINVKVAKWLARGSLATDLPTLAATAQNAALVQAETLKPGSTEDVP